MTTQTRILSEKEVKLDCIDAHLCIHVEKFEDFFLIRQVQYRMAYHPNFRKIIAEKVFVDDGEKIEEITETRTVQFISNENENESFYIDVFVQSDKKEGYVLLKKRKDCGSNSLI
jgi:hypothetical protein